MRIILCTLFKKFSFAT